jgi:hypothetical protein
MGPAGGQLTLGVKLPSLDVPVGALDATGRTFWMKKAEGRPHPAVGAPVSPAFEITPATDAKVDRFFVLSVPAAQLPPGCVPRLAVEHPNNVGPAGGLDWDYMPANYGSGLLSANLVRIHGNRLQFVCAFGGTP